MCIDRNLTAMISSFANPSLESVHRGVTTPSMREPLAAQVRIVLDLLDAAASPDALQMPGIKFGPRAGSAARYSLPIDDKATLLFSYDRGTFSDIDLELV